MAARPSPNRRQATSQIPIRDLDAFVVNALAGDRTWLNDGTGTFTDSGQDPGTYQSLGIGLGDLDGDGDLDAYVAISDDYGTMSDTSNRVWLNDGSRVFTDSG